MLTVLSIEDNPDNMILVDRVIEGLGHKFITARTGLEGLETAETQRPDLILLDINLPDIDGYEVARRLRGSVTSANTPIIAITANALRGDEQRAMESGCSGYIAKPVLIGELRKKIDTVLKQNGLSAAPK